MFPSCSAEIKDYGHEWGIMFTTSSPTYPQSNSQAAIQTMKQALRKAHEDDTDIQLAILVYLNSPIRRMTLSPAQLLMNMRLRDKVPVYSESFQPGVTSDACQQLRDHQRQYTKFYERGVKPLIELQVGDAALVKTRQGWVPVVVYSKCSAPR